MTKFDYYREEFEKVRFLPNDEYYRSFQIADGHGTATNWLNMTEMQFRAIRRVMLYTTPQQRIIIEARDSVNHRRIRIIQSLRTGYYLLQTRYPEDEDYATQDTGKDLGPLLSAFGRLIPPDAEVL